MNPNIENKSIEPLKTFTGANPWPGEDSVHDMVRQSDTPRTDAAAVGVLEVREDGHKVRRMVVDVELCEGLERENARLRATLVTAKEGALAGWDDMERRSAPNANVWSMSLDSVCQTARHKRLVWGLRTLSNWCVSRVESESDCDDRTTITMLERKTRELVISVDKAGWRAIAEHVSANTQGQLRREEKA